MAHCTPPPLREMQLALGLSANIQQVQALSLNISTTIQSRPVYRESKGLSATPPKAGCGPNGSGAQPNIGEVRKFKKKRPSEETARGNSSRGGEVGRSI